MTGIDAGGLPRLVATLAEAGDQLANMREAHTAAGRLIEAEARRRVPVQTGRLSRSILTTVDALGVVVSAGGAGVAYAAPVEARHPFMAPAYAATESAVIDIYATGVADAISQVRGD